VAYYTEQYFLLSTLNIILLLKKKWSTLINYSWDKLSKSGTNWQKIGTNWLGQIWHGTNWPDTISSTPHLSGIQSHNVTGRGPIITNLHVTREGTQIFRPFFADDNNNWWQSKQQYLTFVSWLIQKKSGKIPLETIPFYINLTERSRKRSGDACRYY
jgi:hypothetical protein